MPPTRNRTNTLPTRQQPKRACKRSAEDAGFYSSKTTKRVRSEISEKPKGGTVVIDSRRSRARAVPSKDKRPPSKTMLEHSKRQPTATNNKRKRTIVDQDADEEYHHEDTRPAKSPKRKRYSSAKRNPPPVLEKHVPKPWQLPLELLYTIFDYFWNPETFECSSPKTLHSCALTCSYWRDAVRPYIFRFITLDSTEKIERFAAQVHNEPQVARWVRKIRLEGKTLPWQENSPWTLENAEQDIDQWLYAFPAVLDTHFPYLKTFELFNFAQVSPRLEDREAFARWIPELKALESVTTLNILRCEMSSNNITALVRALPKLTRTDFVDVDFTHPNWAILYTPNPSDSDTELPQESFVEPTELLQVKCPVFHPPPSLQAFRLDVSHAVLYHNFEFKLFRDWFRAESSAQCLDFLEISGRTNVVSLRDFIYALGDSPRLSHLQVPIGPDMEDIVGSGMTISHLTNLTSIRLMGCEYEWGEDELDGYRAFDNIAFFLLQLNSPRLRKVAVTVFFGKEEDIATIASADHALADAKFNGVESIRLELHSTRLEGFGSGKPLIRKVKKYLPLATKRSNFDVVYYAWNHEYLNHALGMPDY